MMTKPKSPPASRWKYLSALPLLLLLFFVMSCRTGNKQAVGFPPPPPPPPPPAAADTLQEDTALLSHEKSFIIVDQQASFQGGDIQTFREWVQKNLKYPEIAIKAGEYGKVIVQFSVSSTGKVIQVKVLRTVTPSLAKAAVEAIQSSPPWIPAKVKGQNVAQQFVMPVVFALK